MTKSVPPTFFAQSLKSTKPTANPTKANALQGKTGNSQACGSPRLCTPLMYDSMGHGSQRIRQVVQSNGVINEMADATTTALVPNTILRLEEPLETNNITQHRIPIRIMESPMVLSTST